MKFVIKLEELGLFCLFTAAYFYHLEGTWSIFLGFFFVPDAAFVLFVISRKMGAITYNIFHHRGVIALVILLGFILQNDIIIKIGLIFIAHSCFDWVFGYGLKYFDSFDHTHLGWIVKSKYKNIVEI